MDCVIQARDYTDILKRGLSNLSNDLIELQTAAAALTALEQSAVGQLATAEAHVEEISREFAAVAAALGELESTAAALAHKNHAFRLQRRQLRAAVAEAGAVSEETTVELAAVSRDLERVCLHYEQEVTDRSRFGLSHS